jgi:uncharacterized protein
VNYRSENGPFENRKQLKKVPRLGEKTSARGFPHFECKTHWITLRYIQTYGIVEKMAKDLKVTVNDLIANKRKAL